MFDAMILAEDCENYFDVFSKAQQSSVRSGIDWLRYFGRFYSTRSFCETGRGIMFVHKFHCLAETITERVQYCTHKYQLICTVIYPNFVCVLISVVYEVINK